MILLVVTCGARGSQYLGNLVEQIDQSGWAGRRFIISDGPPPLRTGWPTIASPEREGQTKTYWRALAVGLEEARRSRADRFVILEDDVELSQNALQYMERTPLHPVLAFVTWFDGHAIRPGSKDGIHLVPAQRFCCLQGVTWRPRTAETLLGSSDVRAFRNWHEGDVLASKILTGQLYGVHVPNLVQHLGVTSLCNPGQDLTGSRTANNYRGRTFDAMTLAPRTWR
jgi:hypothetical protein